MTNNQAVSFDDEKLILVDENDDILGYKHKVDCHVGQGILHRAFSLFIFNSKGELLLQKRGADKPLWPLFWSNSCCSHPRQGESYEIATERRLREELGLETDLVYLYKFQYHAQFGEIGSENELCSVYIGKTDDPVHANPTEIDDWKFVAIDEMEADMAAHSERYSPWFKMEWKRIRGEHQADLDALFAG